MLKNRFKLLTFISVLLLLCSCAGQVNMVPTLTETTKLDGRQGIVVARIINTSAYPLPFNQLTITPINVNESKQIKPKRLESLSLQLSGSTIFSSPVDSGQYSLDSIRAFHIAGDYWYSNFATADATFGTFEVKEGEITDLGTIVYYTKSEEENYIPILLRLPNSQIGEAIKKYAPFYSVNSSQINSWNPDESNDERNNLYVSIVQNPVTYKQHYMADDGSIYFLGKLGLIVKRTPHGSWELDAVDTHLDLNTISTNPNGDLIVGGEEGRLFYKRKGGSWQDISLGHENKIENATLSTNGQVELMVIKNTRLSILRGTADNDFAWKELDNYNSKRGWKSSPNEIKPNQARTSPKRIMSAKLLTLNGSSYITIRSLNNKDQPIFGRTSSKTFIYDPKTWKVALAEDKPKVTYITDAGSIRLGIKEASIWSWSGRPTYLKIINGVINDHKLNTYVYECDGEIIASETCTGASAETAPKKSKKKNFSLSAAPWFKSEDEALVIANLSTTQNWLGKKTNETKLLKSNDGGTTWLDTGHKLPKEYCTQIVPEVVDRLLLSCDGASLDFYESFDDGANWIHVRQQENF